MMNFEFMPKELPSIIKVIGVGGGGSNAVNHMYKLGIRGVDFVVCNTDAQALEMSPVPRKIQLGPSLTEGRGAGSIPEVGKQSAIENIDELKAILSDNTKMVFITAGMGGGTGTGAAPIIAGVAREMGILTVGIVTVPFAFEGRKRKQQADAGIEELKNSVDTLLIICNDKLREIHGNLKLNTAFGYADNVLATAAKSIAEVISVTLHINVDFADVQTVMRDSGVAIMGAAQSSGEGRAIRAAELALDSPLLNDNNIEGARHILLNITSGKEEITMDEMGDITDYIQQKAGQTAEIIMGVGTDDSLGDKISVTIIATGFNANKEKAKEEKVKQPEKIILKMYDETPTSVVNEVTDTHVEEKPVVNEPVLITLEQEIPVTSTEFFEKDNTPEEIVADNSTMEFEFTGFPNVISQNEEVVEPEATLAEDPTVSELPKQAEIAVPEVTSQDNRTPDSDIYKRTRERIDAMKSMNHRISNPQALNEIEKEPAFLRKNVKLQNVLSSGDTNYSRYSLNGDQDKTPGLSKGNKFLHDRPD
ncbi:MAG: cell division protein FtsZ [Bacteroidia bacterium]|mgnify:FL=1